jgi:hypothetical protein
VSDNSVVVCEEKVRFFLLLFRTICHKVGLAIVTVGPSDMDEQLVQLFLGPNKQFWGGLTVGPLWGTFVTKRTKSSWDPVSMEWNVRVELSLGPKAGGLYINAPNIFTQFTPFILSIRYNTSSRKGHCMYDCLTHPTIPLYLAYLFAVSPLSVLFSSVSCLSSKKLKQHSKSHVTVSLAISPSPSTGC